MVPGSGVSATLSIGEFSRLTHLSVKALRHYHEVGLLVPAAIDTESRYRRYDAMQAGDAQLIRRLRALDMPIDEIRFVIAATDGAARDTAIAGHLARMEGELARTQGGRGVAARRCSPSRASTPASSGGSCRTSPLWRSPPPSRTTTSSTGVAPRSESCGRWWQRAGST